MPRPMQSMRDLCNIFCCCKSTRRPPPTMIAVTSVFEAFEADF